jgi:hypothetical protein
MLYLLLNKVRTYSESFQEATQRSLIVLLLLVTKILSLINKSYAEDTAQLRKPGEQAIYHA